MVKKENLMRKLNCINLKNSRHLKYYVIILHHKQNITAKEIILTFLSNYPLIFSALLFLLPLSLDHLWYLVLDQVLTLLTVPSAISLRSSPNHILHRWSSLIASSHLESPYPDQTVLCSLSYQGASFTLSCSVAPVFWIITKSLKISCMTLIAVF